MAAELCAALLFMQHGSDELLPNVLLNMLRFTCCCCCFCRR
jgi:hypothetical protein